MCVCVCVSHQQHRADNPAVKHRTSIIRETRVYACPVLVYVCVSDRKGPHKTMRQNIYLPRHHHQPLPILHSPDQRLKWGSSLPSTPVDREDSACCVCCCPVAAASPAAARDLASAGCPVTTSPASPPPAANCCWSENLPAAAPEAPKLRGTWSLPVFFGLSSVAPAPLCCWCCCWARLLTIPPKGPLADPLPPSVSIARGV